jgi:hypothetical protein
MPPRGAVRVLLVPPAARVVRGTETGTYAEVSLPDGRQRTIFFNGEGRFLAFSTAEATARPR